MKSYFEIRFTKPDHKILHLEIQPQRVIMISHQHDEMLLLVSNMISRNSCITS